MPANITRNNKQQTIKIGILTQPSRFEDKKYIDGYQYIVSSYVKYLEQDLSVKCVPIPFDASQGVLKFLFSQIDGLLFTGGMMNLQSDKAPLEFMTFNGKNVFLHSAKYLFELALEANKSGRYFPVWGTCQGFQLIQILINDSQHNTLTGIEDELYKHNRLLEVSPESKIFNSIDEDILKHMKKYDEIFYYHYWSVKQETYDNSERLKNFFNITAYGQNSKGQKFIAAIEAKKYPIYGVQFHPEIPQFEKKLSQINTLHNFQFGEQLSNFFISEVKMGKTKYEKTLEQFASLQNTCENTTEIINLEQQSTKMPQQCFEEIVFYKNNELLSKVGQDTVSDLVEKTKQNLNPDDLLKKVGNKKKFKRRPKQIATVCVLNCIM